MTETINNLARFVLANPIYGYILMLVCLVGGIHGISNIGRLEDPNFPVKMAYIITAYPGASAEEVEQEVTDRIEDALQALPQVEHIISKSVPGRSEVKVHLYEEYGRDEVPQIFDEMRRRIREAEQRLPPGASTPLVEDDFGDIYGILYALSAPDYANAEVHDMAKQVTNRLKRVPGVGKVNTRSLPQEVVHIEVAPARLTRLGFAVADLAQGLQMENQVADAGSTLVDSRRLRITQPPVINSVDALADMKFGAAGSTEILRLGDVASIRRGSAEVPREIIRRNGEPVIIIAVSVTPGQNVVAVGEAVDATMSSIMLDMPIGVNLEPVYLQHEVVEEAVSSFMQNLIISVLTVMAALMLFMGWRAGAVVGTALLLTVLGTVGIMNQLGIELQRISLGALMIAMGMLVDNAIVIAEGMVMGVRRGLAPDEAAVKAVHRTQFPLLGATIIGILAFAPISLSDDNTGHFLVSLFQVVAISLLLSWLLAITQVPLMGRYLLKPGAATPDEQLYAAWYFRLYRVIISFGLRRAWLTCLVLVGITAASLYSVQFVKTRFFPSNNTPIFYVDYFMQEGTDITATASDLAPIEKQILTMTGMESVTSFVGQGSPRFTAIMQPEQPNPAYARLLVRVDDVTQMAERMKAVQDLLTVERPDAQFQITRAEFTMGSSSKIEMRYSGPDSQVLRQLAEEALAVYLQKDLIDRKTDWRPQSLQLVPVFNEANARLAGISRNDVAQSLAYHTQGVNIGLLRDGDKLIPIVARAPDADRADLKGLKDRQVWSQTQRQYIPITQVVKEFKLEATNSTIYRRNRVRTITAQGNQPEGHNANQFFQRVRGDVEAIALPPGYTMEWGGEYESNKMANAALAQSMPLAFGIMIFITILMFGALRQPLVIWMTVPMLSSGVVMGLLATDLPLTFPSLLGVLSLTGMLIKNSIVLVDEIDKCLAEGQASLGTIMQASISRLRPVMLAAITTVFGMSPLLTDAFFREMAVCIMSGLMFATLLTLIAAPVFYRLLLGKRVSAAGA